MSVFTVRGSTVFVSSELDSETFDTLPVQTYVVCLDPMTGYYLRVAPPFELPSKLYGDAKQKAERFLATFEDRPATTGILLSGAKGSGKSLVMKLTSAMGLERGVPTLIVSSPYCGEAFNQFIQSIDQPCVVIFDEFEKIYDEEHQQYLLTLFDGTFNTKKLMIVTCNEFSKIDYHMTNRPGRMFYYLKYTGLTEPFIREYCQDRLNDKAKITSICTLSAMFYEFNFDMLKALVEELNRYPNESLKEVVEILNINYDYSFRQKYNIVIKNREGKELPKAQYHPSALMNPIQEENIRISLYSGKKNWDAIYETDYDDYEDACADGETIDDGSEEEVKVVRTVEIQMQKGIQDGHVKVSPDLSTVTVWDRDLEITFTKNVQTTWDYSSLF